MTRARLLGAATAAASAPLAKKLGIRRIEVVREVLGDAITRAGDNGTISLSGGDGVVLSWWCVNCVAIIPKQGQCRSPEGCARTRLEGHSYCAQHRALYTAQRPKPTGRMLMLSPAPNRQRRRQAPRLDLVDG